jgi:aminocarboxymuconate-semialdehyde decarboxylase
VKHISSDAGSPLPTGPLQRYPYFTVDIHGHAGSPDVEKLVFGRPERNAEMVTMAASSGPASMAFNANDMLPKAMERMASLETRLRDLEWMGIDHQLLSPSPAQFCYWADPALAADIVAAANASIQQLVEAKPSRFSGLGLVSLQHPVLAARQLEEAVSRLGFAGVEISASVGQRELSDPTFEPFWEAANALGAIVFIHPLGSSLGTRLNRFYLSNTIGQPVETTIALLHIISSGVLDRYPDIRFLGAHGGGYLPHYVGRADHAWRVRPEARGCLQMPSAYLKKIWFDTVVFKPENLILLVEMAGADKVLLGTDYPFDMGDYDPHALIGNCTKLDENLRAAILGGNAKAFLKLKSE